MAIVRRMVVVTMRKIVDRMVEVYTAIYSCIIYTTSNSNNALLIFQCIQ